jgi:hypothetical protein
MKIEHNNAIDEDVVQIISFIISEEIRDRIFIMSVRER